MKRLEQCLAQGPSLQLFDMNITFCFVVDLVQRTDLAKGVMCLIPVPATVTVLE